MVAARWAPSTLLTSLVLAGCSQSTPAGQAAVGDGGQAGEVAQGAAGGTESAPGGSGVAGPGEGGAAGAAELELGELTLSLWSVVEREPVPGHDPTTGQLERVELPPWFTLLANVPPGTRSVEFTRDGETTLDDTPPFLMDEDAYAKARWQPSIGEHEITANAFSEPGAAGQLLATTTQTISYSETGLEPDFVPRSDADNASWVEANLDSVLEPRVLSSALGDSLPYRRFVPAAYDEAVKYPLLVFLHDRAARGADNGASTYASPLFHGKSSLLSPNLQHDFPAVVLVPQCPAEPEHHEWARWYGATEQEPQAGLVFEDGYYPSHDEPSRAAELVRELVEQTLGELSIDPDRVYIAGESMGGLGTWDITWRWPKVWAAAVPIAGYTDPSRAPLLLELPFWVFHSAQDTQDNVIGSLNMVDKLKVLCGSVRYTQYADATHEQTFERVWTSEPQLLPWLWSQKRRTAQ